MRREDERGGNTKLPRDGNIKLTTGQECKRDGSRSITSRRVISSCFVASIQSCLFPSLAFFCSSQLEGCFRLRCRRDEGNIYKGCQKYYSLWSGISRATARLRN